MPAECAHSETMDIQSKPSDSADNLLTYSFWGLGLLISGGIVLAYMIW